MKPIPTPSKAVVLSLALALVPARVAGFLHSSGSTTAFLHPPFSKKQGYRIQNLPRGEIDTPAFLSDVCSYPHLGFHLNAVPPTGGSPGPSNSNQGRPAAANKNNNNNNPAKRFPPRPRPVDTWKVPKSVHIPVEKIDLSFSRSSGAGGQNVNKVNTKVELRFHVLEADWLPLEVRQRLHQQQRGRINKKGFLGIQSQEFRTQDKNRKAAVSKLQGILLQAWPRPVVRKMRTGVTRKAKERKKDFKKKRSQVKQSRRQVGSKDW